MELRVEAMLLGGKAQRRELCRADNERTFLDSAPLVLFKRRSAKRAIATVGWDPGRCCHLTMIQFWGSQGSHLGMVEEPRVVDVAVAGPGGPAGQHATTGTDSCLSPLRLLPNTES